MPQNIPLHQLKNRASAGIEVKYFQAMGKSKEADSLGAHRDDHYLFFLLERGSGAVMLDFSEVHFEEKSLIYILPGQVHHYLTSFMISGWYLAVDAALIPAVYRDVFEGSLLTQHPITLNTDQYAEAHNLLQLISNKFNDGKEDAFHLSIAYSLMQALVGIVANNYSKENNTGVKAPRSAELSRQFKTLLTANYVTHKSPSAYAQLMNVTEGYLNEIVKKITGFPVSYLITNEVMLEAKRLLYYTDLNVKEIAHQLGYEDHTYFSRLFKKTEGETPLEFRVKYLK